MREATDRLRGLRDRVNIRGRSELSIEEKIKCITEIITCAFRPSGLQWARMYISKLKARYPEPTESQIALINELDDRYKKRDKLIRERAAKRERGESLSPRKQKTKETIAPTPMPTPRAPAVDLAVLWGEMLKETIDGHDDTSAPTSDSKT